MKVQYLANKIIEKLCSGHGSMYAVIKEVLKIREGLDIGSVRKPQAGMTEADYEIAKEAAQMIEEAIGCCE